MKTSVMHEHECHEFFRQVNQFTNYSEHMGTTEIKFY